MFKKAIKLEKSKQCYMPDKKVNKYAMCPINKVDKYAMCPINVIS